MMWNYLKYLLYLIIISILNYLLLYTEYMFKLNVKITFCPKIIIKHII